MISAKQKETIDKMCESDIRIAVSVHFQDKDIVDYCEEKLERLNVDSALIGEADLKGFGE